MNTSFSCQLNTRKLLKVAGNEALSFLQGIFTCDVESIPVGKAGFGGLLSPQGKILFDFFVVVQKDYFLLDVEETIADDFLRRLTFYKLRSDVSLEYCDEYSKVSAAWGSSNIVVEVGIAFPDPRLADMGYRVYSESVLKLGNPVEDSQYHEHRILHGMPEGGLDYAYGETFPHEALYDQIGGVDFAKGCYVGQEVISRVHHRGTARKRLIKVASETELPQSGAQISADGKTVGVLASSSGKNGLAMLRLDRVQKAMAAGHVLSCDGISLETNLQSWVQFGWPNS